MRHRQLPASRTVALVWLPWMFAVMGVAVLVLSGVAWYLAWKTTEWPATPGRIILSKTADASSSALAEVAYVYDVSGREYRGRRIFMGAGKGPGFPEAGEIVRRFERGSPVVVYFDPKNPASSVLVPGVSRGHHILALVGLLFFLVGVLAMRRTRVFLARWRRAAPRSATRLPERRDFTGAGAPGPGPGVDIVLGVLAVAVLAAVLVLTLWPHVLPWYSDRDVDLAGEKSAIRSPEPDMPQKTREHATRFQEAVRLKEKALALMRNNRWEQAETLLRRRLAILEQRDFGNPAALITAYNDLANNLERQGKKDEPLELYRKALVHAERHDLLLTAAAAHAALSAGEALQGLGRPKQAIPYLEKALAAWKTMASGSSPNAVRARHRATQVEQRLKNARASARTRKERPPAAAAPVDGLPTITADLSESFTTTGMVVAATSRPRSGELFREKPGGLIRVPNHPGADVFYGTLRYGVGDNPEYHFMLAFASGSAIMYLDFNQNGSLIDEDPLANQGTGPFATVIPFPARVVMPALGTGADIHLWFFVNKKHQEHNQYAYYTRTQLRGRIAFQETRWAAAVAERGQNDGDFTNDGIYVDMDENGKFEDGEYVPPGGYAVLDGVDVRIDVVW
ncbi:MAG: DUF3592 domain-containing protein [Desulfatibacillaceae bacterium]